MLLLLALATGSGCATKSLWGWARRTRYEVTPSETTCRGVSETEGTSAPDRRIWFVVTREDRDRPQSWVLTVPAAWVGLERATGDGDPRLAEMLEFGDVRELPPPTRLRSGAIEQLVDPRTDDARDHDLGWFLNRDGILSVYAADDDAGEWVSLAELETAKTHSISPSPFNYVAATVATPVTAVVDVVGLAGYIVLWPLWASLGVGYDTKTSPPQGAQKPAVPR